MLRAGQSEAWIEAVEGILEENKTNLLTRHDFVLKRDIYFPLPHVAINPRYCSRENHLELYSNYLARTHWRGEDDFESFKKFDLGLARPLRIPLTTTADVACIDINLFRAELIGNLGVDVNFSDGDVIFSLHGGNNAIR